jgi:hypothetical protein
MICVQRIALDNRDPAVVNLVPGCGTVARGGPVRVLPHKSACPTWANYDWPIPG